MKVEISGFSEKIQRYGTSCLILLGGNDHIEGCNGGYSGVSRHMVSGFRWPGIKSN